MGRDNKQGKSKSKDTLPQTPKNQKMKPNEVQEEFSRELANIEESSFKNKQKNK